MNAAPKALSILMDFAENSASDSVKFQASKDLLDRAGFRSIDRREEIRPQHTPEELEAEIKRLVGSETAELLLGKKTMDDLVQEKIEQKKGAEVVNRYLEMRPNLKTTEDYRNIFVKNSKLTETIIDGFFYFRL